LLLPIDEVLPSAGIKVSLGLSSTVRLVTDEPEIPEVARDFKKSPIFVINGLGRQHDGRLIGIDSGQHLFQRHHDFADGLNPLCRILDQHLLKESIKRFGDVGSDGRERRDGLLAMGQNLLIGVAPRVNSLAGEHSIQRTAQTVNVGPGIRGPCIDRPARGQCNRSCPSSGRCRLIRLRSLFRQGWTSAFPLVQDPCPESLQFLGDPAVNSTA